MASLMDTILPAEVGKPVTGSTQEHLQIQAIHDDVIILKDGSAAMVLQTSAVNFDLLSENEQLAIISSFAGLLNSLSFPIQIVIRSKRLDISKYLGTLKKIEEIQTNPLLKDMTKRYRVFVETLTSENEVLDKQFYVVVSVSYLEIGITNQIEKDLKKAITILVPRGEHLIKQLARIGLKTNQLNTEKLIGLFHDYYNETTTDQDIRAFVDKQVSLKTPPSQTPPSVAPEPAMVERPEVKIADPDLETNKPPVAPPAINDPHYLKTRTEPELPTNNPTAALNTDQPRPARVATPFVVEELKDDYGRAG